MELLSELLRLVRIESAAVAQLSLAAPFHWRVDYPEIWSITAVRGRCFCVDASGRVHELAPGDSVLGLRSPRWSLATNLDQPSRDLGALWEAQGLPRFAGARDFAAPLHLRAGVPGETVELLGLAFGVGDGKRPPLFELAPCALFVPGGEFRERSLIDAAMALVAQQSAQPRPGYLAVAGRLAETIFISLLRAGFLALDKGDVAWLPALREPRLAQALLQVHAHPERHWSVADIADVAGMARSTFAKLFADVLCTTPLQYLTDLRIRLACQRLAVERVPIGALAEQCGYASERAFRAAFRRHCGQSPRAWQSLARASTSQGSIGSSAGGRHRSINPTRRPDGSFW